MALCWLRLLGTLESFFGILIPVRVSHFHPCIKVAHSSLFFSFSFFFFFFSFFFSFLLLLLLVNLSFPTRLGEILRTLYHQYPIPRPIFASGANGSWVRGVAYARNGCQIATIADDGYLRFWNLLQPDVDPVAIALGDEDMVCCTFSPSGSVFAVG